MNASRGGLVLMLALTAAGCTLGPDYERPALSIPSDFRGAASAAPPASNAPALAERSWASIFREPSLRELIQIALRDGYDVRIAATRVLEAEARAGVVRSAAYPALNAGASAAARTSELGGRSEPSSGGFLGLGLGLSWELDFWGRISRANEGARAEIFASEWARRAVVTSVVSEVATTYFALRALDQQLEIAQRTLAARQQSLRLTQARESGGAGSIVDVKQAEQLVYGASAELIDLQRRIEQGENLLATLLGQNPGPIARAAGTSKEGVVEAYVAEVPSGLPSALLERRPDIREAEQRLAAETAEIGAAKADYVPRISLTGSGGIASAALSTLVSGPSAVWTAAAKFAQPVFDGQRTASRVRLSELERDRAELAYRQTILRAFREVSDALVEYRRGRELRSVRQELVHSAKETLRLSMLRYQAGATSYLEVLDSDTRLMNAELELSRAELRELSAFVEIYRALGGGWG